MRPVRRSYAALLALYINPATSLDGIVVPGQVAANTDFQITFQDGNSDAFRVYLAAALAGTNGPACYLINSTTLTSPLTLSIPSSVGPSADHYTIAIADLTTAQRATFSNHFNLTNATGHYSDYENHLGGAAFWDADHLPCAAYACARQCAQAGYPNDLSQPPAYATMKACILQCPGVSPAPNQTVPAYASPSAAAATNTRPPHLTTRSASAALVTLAPDLVLTAVETYPTGGASSSSSVEEAVLGSVTLTLGGAPATVSGVAVSLASSGVEVGGTATAGFRGTVETVTVTESGAAGTTGGVAAATSSGAAAAAGVGRSGLSAGGGGGCIAVAVAGLAVLI